jgi:hypothetical protein
VCTPPEDNLEIGSKHVMGKNKNIVNTRWLRLIKSRRMRWAGYAGHMRGKRNSSRALVGKPERKR